MIVIVTHRHADFDALGAVVAAQLLTPDAVPVIDTGNAPVETFLALHREALGIRRAAGIDWAAVDHVIAVDTQDPARIDVLPADRIDHVTWRIVDHHPDLGLHPGNSQIEPVGAAVTLLVEALREQGLTPSALQATTMALGIHVDTGGLLFPKTSARDASAYAWLLGQGANLDIVRQYVHFQLPESLQDLLEQLLAHGTTVTVAGHAGTVAAIVTSEYVDSAAIAVEHWADLVGTPFVVAVIQMGRKVQLIGRASRPELDLSAAWQSLGARGHAAACHVQLKDRTAADVLNEAVALLERGLPNAPLVRQMMTAPVLSVPPDTCVRDAWAQLSTWGHATLPIVNAEDRPVGIVSRVELDKALRHGLAEAPVSGVMRQPTTIDADTPQAALPGLLVGSTLSRLLIVDHGRLKGIVSGGDVVRHVYGPVQGSAADRPDPQAISVRLAAWAGQDVISLLREAGAIAARLGMPLYWVGGSVRDLLLAREAPPDIDLVVDGDGIAFATAWAGAEGLAVTLHEQFGTAKLVTPSGPVDVASSRRETYAYPGAQPDVRFSPIALDLARRDFTINAMAIRLDPPHFGQLLDFFGGWRDLHDKRLAVLHPLSYMEDPSRVWRAVRFEQRLGFRLTAADEAQAGDALANARFQGYVNHRIAQEMRLLWSRQAEAWSTLSRLAELGALRGIGVTVDDQLIDRFRRLETSQTRLRVPENAIWLGYLAILLLPLAAERRAELVSAMKLSDRERTDVAAAWAAMTTPVPDDDVALYAWGQGRGELAIACAMAGATDTDLPLIERYWRTLRGAKLAITGSDLTAMGFRPGPMFGRVLSAVLQAKLAGKVASPEEERQLAARLAAAEEPHADRSE